MLFSIVDFVLALALEIGDMLIFSSFERGTLLISTNCVGIGILHIHIRFGTKNWVRRLNDV